MGNKHEEQQIVKTKPENKDTKQRVSASGRAAISILTAFFLSSLVLTCSLPLDEISYTTTRGIPFAIDQDTWFTIPTTADGDLKDITLSCQSEAGKYYSIEILSANSIPASGVVITVSSIAGSAQYFALDNGGTAHIFQPDGPVKIAIHSAVYLTGLKVRCRAIPTLESGIPVSGSTLRGSMDVYRIPFTGTLPVDYFVRDEVISSIFTARTTVRLCDISGTEYSATVLDDLAKSGCIMPPAGETAFFIKVDTYDSNSSHRDNVSASYEILFRNPELHTLGNDAWSDGGLKPGNTLWYTCPTVAGENYWVYLDDSLAGSGTKTGQIQVITIQPGTSVSSYHNSGLTTDNAFEFLSFVTGEMLIRVRETWSDTKNSSQDYSHSFKIKQAVTTDLSDNIWYDSSIAQYETQYFRIPVSAGETCSVNWYDSFGTAAAGKTASILVSASNTDNSVSYFTSASVGYSSPRTIFPPADGYIRLAVKGMAPGTYGIRVKKMPTTLLTEGTWCDGSLSAGDIQYFAMALDQGCVYTIKTNDAASGDGSKTATIWLTSTKSGTILFNQAGSSFIAGHEFLSTGGILNIQVFPADSYHTGTYSLVVSKVTVPVLAENVWTAGTITTDTKTRYFLVPFSGSGTCYVNWDDSYSGSGTYTLDVAVSASNGTTTFFNRTDSAYNHYSTLTPGGPFWLKVEPYGGGTGTFAIRYKTTP